MQLINKVCSNFTTGSNPNKTPKGAKKYFTIILKLPFPPQNVN